MTGRTSNELIGAPFVDWVEPSVAEICTGVEDRESGLQGRDGSSLPVDQRSRASRAR